MQTEFRRAFFALWPPPGVAAALHRLGEGKSGQVLGAEDLHLTLAFVGDLDAARCERLQRIAAGLALPRCRLCFGRLNYWSHNRILWTGPEFWPVALADFVSALHAALLEAGFCLDERDFVPHVTLLRKAAAGQEDGFAREVEWDLAGWCLAASAGDVGARYRRLAEWGIA